MTYVLIQEIKNKYEILNSETGELYYLPKSTCYELNAINENLSTFSQRYKTIDEFIKNLNELIFMGFEVEWDKKYIFPINRTFH